MVEVSSDVSDALGVHDVNVVVLPKELPGGGELGFAGRGHTQVWSLTQFYSVGFSQSRIDVKKCVFYKRTIKVCVRCCLRCPGTFAPSAAHLTVSLYLCSSGSNA